MSLSEIRNDWNLDTAAVVLCLLKGFAEKGSKFNDWFGLYVKEVAASNYKMFRIFPNVNKQCSLH